MPRKLVAEFIGTALLTCVVVGSGIMGDALSEDNGVSLLINSLVPVSALAVLIFIIGPISGAHFNPIVSLVNLANKTQKFSETALYIVVQIAGSISGAIFANFMFDLPSIQFSGHERVTGGTFIGEIVATAGLILVIGILVNRKQDKLIPIVVAGWIFAAIFFTSSTSFANPAVTIGRSYSDTFAGIATESVLPFIAAQLIGGIVGWLSVKAVTTKA